MIKMSSIKGETVNSNRRLAQFNVQNGLGFLSNSAREAAIWQLADTVAVGWAGSDAKGVAEAADVMIAEGGMQIVPLWGRAERVSASQAAFINGVAGAALDFDSVHQTSLLHPAVITVPVALSLGALLRVSGEDVVNAHLVGCEVMCRISLATPRQSNWFPASVFGIYGATATAAQLLGLDTEQTLNAYGLALAQTSGTKQAIMERTLAKRYQTAFAVRAGLLAAQLAARGVTAAEQFLDGPAGLFALYEPGDVNKICEGLGEEFIFEQTTIKKYPSCLCTHVAIEGIRRLKEKHKLEPKDVKDITVTITEYMNKLVGGEYKPGVDPQVAAQFSIKYAVACMLKHGNMTLGDIDPQAATDPEMVRLAQSINIQIFDEYDGHVAPARVSISLNNGETHSEMVTEVPNAVDGAAATDHFQTKIIDCLQRGHRPLKAPEARELCKQLLNIDKVDDLSMLFNH